MANLRSLFAGLLLLSVLASGGCQTDSITAGEAPISSAPAVSPKGLTVPAVGASWIYLARSFKQGKAHATEYWRDTVVETVTLADGTRCQLVHSQINWQNDEGLSIRLPFPRSQTPVQDYYFLWHVSNKGWHQYDMATREDIPARFADIPLLYPYPVTKADVGQIHLREPVPAKDVQFNWSVSAVTSMLETFFLPRGSDPLTGNYLECTRYQVETRRTNGQLLERTLVYIHPQIGILGAITKKPTHNTDNPWERTFSYILVNYVPTR